MADERSAPSQLEAGRCDFYRPSFFVDLSSSIFHQAYGINA
jgi:hypothetical protein